MSIGPAVGALSTHLTELRDTPKRTGSNGPSSFFETLGFRHIGPVDGHDLDRLVSTLSALRDESDCGPVVIHVVTEKVTAILFQNLIKKNITPSVPSIPKRSNSKRHRQLSRLTQKSLPKL